MAILEPLQKILRPFIFLLMVVAALGFVVSVAVHVGACLGVRLFSHLEVMHLGIFLVFVPAVLVILPTVRNVPQKDVWKVILKGLPAWVRRIGGVLLGYTVLNFILFIYLSQQTPQLPTSEGLSPLQVRGFSGHWMLFYYAAFLILYSASRNTSLLGQACPSCKKPTNPLGQFCENCGTKLQVRL